MTKSPEQGSIYGLFDSEGALRYVGKAVSPKKRLAGHMKDSRKRNTPLYAWIRKHGQPDMRVLEANCADWQEAEKRLIREAIQRGDKLLNLAEGGIQPYCSTEQRSRNAKALNQSMRDNPRQKRIRDIKHIISNGLRLGFVNDETRSKLRLAASKNPSVFGCWSDIPNQVSA